MEPKKRLESHRARLRETIKDLVAAMDTVPADPVHRPASKNTLFQRTENRPSSNQYRLKAEAIVKAQGWPTHRGKPSKRGMMNKLGCSFPIIDKLLNESPVLKRAYMANAPGAAPGSPVSELGRLIAEQKLDEQSHHA